MELGRRIQKALTETWYYSVEIEPGRFVKGMRYKNVSLTRNALARCDVSRRRCLDIGTMEGLIPVLMERKGASFVTATDAIDQRSRINLVRDVYGCNFDYLPNILTDQLPSHFAFRYRQAKLQDPRAEFGFDVVVMSGVLYHVMSPVMALGAARSVLKDGGIFILETAAINADGYYMRFNFDGKGMIFTASDTWFATLPLLDSLLRLLRLRPIDVLYFPSKKMGDTALVRVCVVCRAVAELVLEPHEEALRRMLRNYDFANILRNDYPRETCGEEVPFAGCSNTLETRADGVTCDVFKTVQNGAPYACEERERVLSLSDVS